MIAKQTIRRRVAILAVCLVLSLFTHSRALAAASGPKTLPGAVPDVVRQGRAHLVGAHAAGDSIGIAVGLRLRDEAGLSAFLRQVNDPSSPRYHHFLSQDEANAAYNPTADQEQRVVRWLQDRGLHVTGTYPNHLLVDARGTADQIGRAFGVTLNDYTVKVHGKDHAFFAPDQTPTVDSSIADTVDSVTGLDTIPRFHTGTNGSAHGSAPYYPQDFANAYDVNPLWTGGATGSGQHIGITLWTVPPSDSTLQAFASTTGASVATTANGRLTVIPVDGGVSPTVSPDAGEAGMDIEYASGMAPGATIDYYEAPTDAAGNPTDQGLEDALNQAGTDAANNRQITNSWGGCEATSTADPFTSTTTSIFSSNAATGHNYFFSSGDNGSWCDPASNGTGADPYADYPASSPNVTSVGGTAFNAGIGGSYPGESAWAYCASCGGAPEGSGGGYSSIFGRPSWQTGSGLAANGKRGYPDIAADADPNTGAYVCYGRTTSCGQIGGTSLASPLWAGMLAVVNSYLAAQGKSPAGFLNPTLYDLITTPQPYAPVHDITSGTNGAFNAAAGWDAVTGWGSPDLFNLARDLGGPALTSLAGSVTVQAGAGWNLVGGSPLTLWTGALVNWSFNAATPAWFHPNGSEAPGTGAWEDIGAAGQRTVQVQACTGSVTIPVVAHRWNLVGNPCGLAVLLPGTARAYRWDPAGRRYVLTNGIGAGAAVWSKPEGSTLTLTLTTIPVL